MGTTGTDDRRALDQLRFGADWACAHGDLAALRHCALQLARHAHEPMHGALVDLADACAADPERAVKLWSALRQGTSQRARLAPIRR